MDCNQSEYYIMQHFEKTIKPKNAVALSEHVANCEACRALFLTMDEAMDCVIEDDFAAPPVDFTDSVMAKVHEMPCYSKSASARALKAVWAVSAVLFGSGLTLMLNPELLNHLATSYPIVETVTNAIHSVNVFINSAIERFTQRDTTITTEPFGIVALFLTAVTGTLLYVLHSGETVEA